MMAIDKDPDDRTLGGQRWLGDHDEAELFCVLGIDCPYPRTCCMVCGRHHTQLHTNCILR